MYVSLAQNADQYAYRDAIVVLLCTNGSWLYCCYRFFNHMSMKRYAYNRIWLDWLLVVYYHYLFLLNVTDTISVWYFVVNDGTKRLFVDWKSFVSSYPTFSFSSQPGLMKLFPSNQRLKNSCNGKICERKYFRNGKQICSDCKM